jgi:hypothetical protein
MISLAVCKNLLESIKYTHLRRLFKMSNIIETLTEGIVNRNQAAEGKALLAKWTATGLLEGLETQHKQATMARLLENQARELLRESSSMSGGDVQGFAALIANDIVSVQPMSLPSGLIFFMDFVFSPTLNGTESAAGSDRFGNVVEKSIYGTDKTGSEITGGVNLVGATYKETLGGPREAVGYAYASPTGSTAVTAANANMNGFAIAGCSEANAKKIQFDADLMADTTLYVVEVLIDAAGVTELVTGLYDDRNFAAIFAEVDNAGGTDLVAALGGVDAGAVTVTADTLKAVRRLTRMESGILKMYYSTTVDTTGIASDETPDVNLTVLHPKRDAIDSGDGAKGAIAGFTYPLEGNSNIPEIDIKVDQVAITAQTKKLKAKWTPELGQDLNAYHNLDAEVELTSILSEQIALEIDREILADLVNGATAATYYWSRSPGLFVNRTNGLELGATSAAPDFTGTVSEWYETLIETINDVSAQIHRKTLRGGANFVVCSPEVANILEFTSGFRANITADADKGSIGAVKTGSLSRKWDVMVDPYFPRNVVLVGRKGSSFLESGYVYAPYVPLQTTPTIFGVEDFVPRKGVMTRYGKKMVRPDMYGLVIVRGLLGESGS